MKQAGQVHLVGAGPGNPELLTLRALRLIEGADAIVYDRLVSPGILALAPAGARVIPVGKAPGCHSVPQERINEILHELALEGLDVVRLKGGDPFIFGRGAEEAAWLRARGVAVDICPGITAAQGAAASAGVPLTHRGIASGVRYVTGHRMDGRPLDLDWAGLAHGETTLVIYMGAASMAEIALRLIAQGRAGDTPVLAVSNATTPDERRILSDLVHVAGAVKRAAPEGPVLFIVGEVAALGLQEAGVSVTEGVPAASVRGLGVAAHA